MPLPDPHTPGNPISMGVTPEAERAGEPEPPVSIEEALRRERERVAQMLHDTICQEVTGFHYLASALSIQCKVTDPAAAEKLQMLAEKIQTAGRELGKLISTLRNDEQSRSLF